jgi:uncharacterized cupredoxin-like copper-binding protein
MKQRLPLLFIVMLVILLVVACGSPAPATTQESAQPAATQPEAIEILPATEAPVQPGATEAVPVSGSSTQVDVTLADNTIESSMASFQVGVPYTFVITNAGEHAHNFNINPPVSITGSLQGSFDSALLVVPQEQLAPGQTATVEFTFPDSASGQLLEFSCLIRRHYDDGMKMDIIVSQ